MTVTANDFGIPSTFSQLFPAYVSHKKVHAAQIVGVGPKNEKGEIELFFSSTESLTVDEKMTARYHPTVGDYVVTYADGYRSISPKAAFEEGYTRV